MQLVGEAVSRDRRGQRPDGRIRRRRIARLDRGQRGGELLHERLIELVGDDETLGRVAGLAGVLEAGVDRLLDRRIHVVGAEQDERIGTAQLQHHLLEVATGDLGHGRPGALRTSQRHAAHPRIRDHPLDLFVGGVDVDVGVLGEASVVEHLLDGRGRLRALGRVLEQNGVADHQVRAREPRHLVVGVVPRHDPQQDPERAAADERRPLAGEQLNRLVGHELLGVVGVEAVDVDAEVDLSERLLDRLAHLAHDDLGELFPPLAVELSDPAHQGGPLGDRARL